MGRTEQFDLVTSPPILEELQEALSRPKIRRRYHLSASDIHNFLTLLTQATILVTGTGSVSASIHDPDDLLILATAVEAHADYLVTGDTGLLKLKRFQSIQIVSPAVFLKTIAP
ncbi:MAG: putative toxin-antitoxin system toxin component, PIN family [Nitrospira sp.]|nr:putative toxin-antitoxin system toxin component, PIN family [Nitrospira sp.]